MQLTARPISVNVIPMGSLAWLLKPTRPKKAHSARLHPQAIEFVSLNHLPPAK